MLRAQWYSGDEGDDRGAPGRSATCSPCCSRALGRQTGSLGRRRPLRMTWLALTSTGDGGSQLPPMPGKPNTKSHSGERSSGHQWSPGERRAGPRPNPTEGAQIRTMRAPIRRRGRQIRPQTAGDRWQRRESPGSRGRRKRRGEEEGGRQPSRLRHGSRPPPPSGQAAAAAPGGGLREVVGGGCELPPSRVRGRHGVGLGLQNYKHE